MPILNFQLAPKPIWIDSDLAIGSGNAETGYADVDDAFAILHLLFSPEVSVTGLSSVFGNTDIDTATELCQSLSQRFTEGELHVYRGAASAMELKELIETEAVTAMRDALLAQSQTIMAIGPATNVATLLLLYPEIASQIESVVLVAGRRSTEQHFVVGPKHDPPFPDLNFDLDPDAFRVLLESGVKVVLLPFEISHKVWVGEEYLQRLGQSGEAGAYLSRHSANWLKQWEAFGADAFNPFDLLASGYILWPELYSCEELYPQLRIAPDDTKTSSTKAFKPYLILTEEPGAWNKVRYCHQVDERFMDMFVERLLQP